MEHGPHTFWVKLVLLIIALDNIFSVIGIYLLGMFFENLPTGLAYGIGILSILNLVFAYFIFRWKKAAFFAICSTTLLKTTVLILATKSLFLPEDLIMIACLYYFLKPNWTEME
jgi:hypothetical protein